MGTAQLCYDLLAMRQVLTVPAGTPLWGRRVWQSVPKALYYFPLVVQGYGSYTLWLEYRMFLTTAPGYSAALGFVDALLMSVTLLLTLTAHALERQHDRVWREVAGRLNRASPSAPAAGVTPPVPRPLPERKAFRPVGWRHRGPTARWWRRPRGRGRDRRPRALLPTPAGPVGA